jgi:AcrR family transcriptional regulator
MADKERKNQIIRAALKRFAKHGLHKTTLDEVARDLRIGKATLYHYFDSKEDLYNQTLRYEVSLYLEELKTIFSDKENSLRSRLTVFFILKETLQNKYKLIYDLAIHIITCTEFPDEKEIFNEMLLKEKEFFLGVVTSEFKNPAHKPEKLTSLIISQGWFTVFNQRITTEDTILPDSKDLIFDIIEKG